MFDKARVVVFAKLNRRNFQNAPCIGHPSRNRLRHAQIVLAYVEITVQSDWFTVNPPHNQTKQISKFVSVAQDIVFPEIVDNWHSFLDRHRSFGLCMGHYENSRER